MAILESGVNVSARRAGSKVAYDLEIPSCYRNRLVLEGCAGARARGVSHFSALLNERNFEVVVCDVARAD